MKVTLFALTGVLVAASFCACNNNNDNTDTNNIVNGTDSMFVMKAGMGNTAEVQAAQLALTRSTDASILNFANTMIADHTAAQNSLKNIASNYGLTPPDTVDAAHKEMALILSQLSGRAFDSTYIHGQVVDHQSTVQLFQTERTSGNNINLKNFADTTLPKLQMHLDSANNIASHY